MTKGKPWKSVLIGPTAYAIYVRTWLRKLFGYCRSDLKRIYISGSQDEDEFEDTLSHELEHGIFEEAGVADWLIKQFGAKKAHRMEEYIISKTTPVRLIAYKDLGWKPPRYEE